MSIGQELLDVPFPEMIFKMAKAIAQGQTRLDKASLDTARALARAKVSVIPEIFEIVESKKISDTAEVPEISPLALATRPRSLCAANSARRFRCR